MVTFKEFHYRLLLRMRNEGNGIFSPRADRLLCVSSIKVRAMITHNDTLVDVIWPGYPNQGFFFIPQIPDLNDNFASFRTIRH